MAENKKFEPKGVRVGRGLIVAAIILGLAPVAGVLFYQSEYDQAATDRTGEYAKGAANEVGNSCRGVPPAHQVICFANARIKSDLKKKDNERNEADLAAQRKTALWTMWMAVVAFAGMALSLVGVFLVLRTFGEAREANEIARREQRAWVSLNVAPKLVRHTERDNGLYMRIDFTAENMGKSLATHFELQHALFFKGEKESGRAVATKMKRQIAKWKAQYLMPAKSVLLPNDRVVSGIWKSYSGKAVKWSGHFRNNCQPMMLAAVFYRTVCDPNIVQMSWQSWYLFSLDENDKVVARIEKPENELGPHDLHAEVFHYSATHEEYPAELGGLNEASTG